MPHPFNAIGSIHAGSSLFSILALSALMMYILMIASLFKDFRYLIQFIKLTLVFIFVITAFGILHRITGTDKLFWVYPMNVGKSFFMTFPYENTYGVYAMMLFPFANAMAAIQLSELTSDRESSFWQRFLKLIESPFIFYLLLQVMLIVAIFLSNSRLSSIVLIIYLILELIRALLRRNWLYISFYATTLSAAALFITKSLIWEYFTGYKEQDLVRGMFGRLEITAGALNAFFDRPWLGWGLDGFQHISQRYVVGNAEYFYYKHANNEFVELLSEVGIVGFAIFAVALGSFIYTFMKNRKRMTLYTSHIMYACYVSITLLAISVAGDSHLRVPACSFLLAILVGMIISQTSFQEDVSTLDRPVKNEKDSYQLKKYLPHIIFMICVCLMFSIWSLNLGKVLMMKRAAKNISIKPLQLIEFYGKFDADYWMLKSRIEYANYQYENKMGEKQEALSLIVNSIQSTEEAIKRDPSNPFIHNRHAQLCLINQEHLKAIESFERAVENAPYNNKIWVNLISAVHEAKNEFRSSVKLEQLGVLEDKYARMMEQRARKETLWQIRQWSRKYDTYQWDRLARRYQISNE